MILILLSFLYPHLSSAKVFQNSYIQFELPERWDCTLEGTEWVCRSLVKEQSKEAIIVLTAKEVGPSDSLENYENHLKQPRTVPNKEGKPNLAMIKSLQKRQINGHTWIDSMHLGSELPQYYTRYLATVKDRLAILITFSAHQSFFTKYSSDILRAVQSLRVTAQFSLAPSPGSQMALKPEIIGTPIAVSPDFSVEEFPPEIKQGKSGKLLALFLLVAAIGGYIFLKKRKKN